MYLLCFESTRQIVLQIVKPLIKLLWILIHPAPTHTDKGKQSVVYAIAFYPIESNAFKHANRKEHRIKNLTLGPPQCSQTHTPTPTHRQTQRETHTSKCQIKHWRLLHSASVLILSFVAEGENRFHRLSHIIKHLSAVSTFLTLSEPYYFFHTLIPTIYSSLRKYIWA